MPPDNLFDTKQTVSALTIERRGAQHEGGGFELASEFIVFHPPMSMRVHRVILVRHIAVHHIAATAPAISCSSGTVWRGAQHELAAKVLT